jgi:hypothetical protein
MVDRMRHPQDSLDLLQSFAQMVETRGVGCLLIGGWALNFHGVARHTIDIDFMIIDTVYAQISEIMAELGFHPVVKTDLVVRFQHRTAFPLFGFLFVEKRTFMKLMGNALKIKIAEADFSIPSLENLLAMKIHSLKNNYSNRHIKDFPDIINLIMANSVNLDTIKELCDRFGSQDLYEEIRKAPSLHKR